MTCREKLAIEHPEHIDPSSFGGCRGCPSSFGYLYDMKPSCTPSPEECTECWDREIPEETVDTEVAVKGNEPHIKDSGNRREFDSGAVRDMAEGKGRCDLMPLDVVWEFLQYTWIRDPKLCTKTLVFRMCEEFQITGDVERLFDALKYCGIYEDPSTLLLEVAKHFEEGCKKYGENNWRKGIPVKFYIDSAVRHYLKYLRGDKDEPHDRAFCWNILCAIWTHEHKPELRINPEEPITE